MYAVLCCVVLCLALLWFCRHLVKPEHENAVTSAGGIVHQRGRRSPVMGTLVEHRHRLFQGRNPHLRRPGSLEPGGVFFYLAYKKKKK